MIDRNITLTGLVATTPRQSNGQTIFRLVSMGDDDERADWFTVYTDGQTAENVFVSVYKGHRVLVYGRLAVVDWDNGETTGTSVEIHAEAIGHDLVHNTTEATRTYPRKGEN